MALIPLLLFMSLLGAVWCNTNLFWPYDEHAEHMFDSSDFNFDGILDVSEMQEAFKHYDLNNDGRVHRQEYVHYVTYYNPNLSQFADAVFNDYDCNPEDGYVDPADFQGYINMLDTDADGQVVKTEFVAHWVNVFITLEHLHVIPTTPHPQP